VDPGEEGGRNIGPIGGGRAQAGSGSDGITGQGWLCDLVGGGGRKGSGRAGEGGQRGRGGWTGSGEGGRGNGGGDGEGWSGGVGGGGAGGGSVQPCMEPAMMADARGEKDGCDLHNREGGPDGRGGGCGEGEGRGEGGGRSGGTLGSSGVGGATSDGGILVASA